MRRFAISDIHGCLKSFEALLKHIIFTKKDELYILGDYIDRGPDSKGVIDKIWSLQESGHTVHCLRGNHEQMLLDGLDNDVHFMSWVRNGGGTTLGSFGVNHSLLIPQKYKKWIRDLPYYLEVDKYILVHAGLDFYLENPLEGLHNMLWIRGWYDTIGRNWLDGRIVIHGHTPMHKTDIKKAGDTLVLIPALDVDAGCVFKNRGYGHLCAYDMTNEVLYFQENVEHLEEA